MVTMMATMQVWYLPGIAKRFNLDEAQLRRKLFEHTGGMFPELVTRSDLSVFLPPIGGAISAQPRRNDGAISAPSRRDLGVISAQPTDVPSVGATMLA